MPQAQEISRLEMPNSIGFRARVQGLGLRFQGPAFRGVSKNSDSFGSFTTGMNACWGNMGPLFLQASIQSCSKQTGAGLLLFAWRTVCYCRRLILQSSVPSIITVDVTLTRPQTDVGN